MGRWFFPRAFRGAVYVYFAIGVGGLIAGGLFGVFVGGLVGLLVLMTWNSFGRPMSPRHWIPLLAVGTVGVIRIFFFNQGWPFPGAGAFS